MIAIYIFNLCESLGGISQHEQHVAALMEVLGKRFTGAGAFGLALAQDKGLSKKLFHFHGLPYPKFSTMDAGQVEWSDDLSFPLFVKPLNEDASIGIDSNAVVQNVKELMERISYIQTEFKAPALIEEYIEGREIYIGILGNEKPEPLQSWNGISPKYRKAFQGLLQVKQNGMKILILRMLRKFFQPIFPKQWLKNFKRLHVNAFKILKLRDYGRIDMRYQAQLKKRK